MSVNCKLLTMWNRPVKFFLEGFIYLDILRSTKLIIIHGGLLLSKPDDDTIVLSPSTGFSAPNYARFDISWLHDSISKNQFLDIMKYILPSPKCSDDSSSSKKASTAGCSEDFTAKMQFMEEKKKRYPEVQTNSNIKSSPSTFKQRNTAYAKRTLTSDDPDELHESEIAKIQSITESTSNVRISEVPDAIIEISSESDDSDTEKNNSHDTGYNSLNVSLDTARASTSRDVDSSASTEPIQETTETSLGVSHSAESSDGNKLPYSREENQKMINYLIENDAISKACSRTTWRQGQCIFVEPSRTATSLHAHFLSFLRYHVGKYTGNATALREFEKLNKQLGADSKKRVVQYSKNEEKRMIQYLVDKRVTHRVAQMTVWEEMAAAKIFQNPRRAALSLRMHFRTHMRKSFKYYTNDAKALDDLKRYFKSLGVKNRKNVRYSEAERRRIVQYLIDNNAIFDAFGQKIWQRMESEKILVEPFRSARSLYGQFYTCLQHQYMKYTDNPQAMEKFKILKKRRKYPSLYR